MSESAYNKLEINGKHVIIKEGIKESLAKVDAIIFDCDGVLIDISDSYNKAIHKTVEYLFSIMSVDADGHITTDAQIEALRICGGFNNDWDTTYVLSEWTFLNMPKEWTKYFSNVMNNLEVSGSLIDVVNMVSNSFKKARFRVSLREQQVKFVEMLKGIMKTKTKAHLDRYDIDVMMDAIAAEKELTKELLQFRMFLGYPGNFGECLLVTVFDELFYGLEGVEAVYNMKPFFFNGPGLFQNERPLIEEETLIKLQRIVGHSKLTIASGRDRWSAKRVLGKLFEYFDQEAAVFLADEVRLIGPEAQKVGKPDPYSLLKAVSYLLPKRNVLYVGDSAEDLLMAKNANESMNRFVFAGVYASSNAPELKIEYFMEKGADIIIPSVNELPHLFTYSEGGCVWKEGQR
ncbi:MAG: HAD-IA family hydrolase [Nitrososphaerota archaeon]|nr:HAD-IA family hydrolase [Aigarchaeota archaeon]MDW8076922.1 HAD-IA family hydrolase [Nitrososphaerota archaeon]